MKIDNVDIIVSTFQSRKDNIQNGISISFDLKYDINIEDLLIQHNSNIEQPFRLIGYFGTSVSLTLAQAEYISKEFFRLNK